MQPTNQQDDGPQAIIRRPLRLPPELVDQVIQEPSASHVSLSNCLLVCREWTRIAYPYHFAGIYFYAIEAEEPNSSPTPRTAPHREDAFSFGDFLAFLQHAPMVCACVKDLHLEGERSLDIKVALDLATLSDILEALPGLRCLELTVPAFEHSSAPMGTPFRSFPIRLEQLHLEGLTCAPSSISTLLSLFTSVSHLAFSEVSTPEPPEPMQDVENPNNKFHIPSIDVSTTWYTEFQEWAEHFFPLFDPNSLSAMYISTPENEFNDADALQPLLAAVGHNLEELSYGWSDREHDTPLDLTSCSNLRTLTTIVSMPSPDLVSTRYATFQRGSWPATLTTLIRAPTSVRAMTLAVLFSDGFDMDFELGDGGQGHRATVPGLTAKFYDLDLCLLDIALSNHSSLKSFNVKLLARGMFEHEEDTELLVAFVEKIFVEKCFSTPARRNLLQVEISV